MITSIFFGTISSQLQTLGFPSDTYTIEFQNPSYNHKIWRSGIERTGNIVPPTGYTATWQILNHQTRAVVTSGSGNTVTYTFTFVTMAACNVYDLLVTVTNGSNTFKRLFPGEFTCLPQVPASYSITWNTSGDKAMGWTNRAGTKILATGSLTRLNPYWLKSDDPTNPVHVVLKNLDIQTSTNIISFGMTAFKNVIIDGCTEEDVQYGAVIQKLTGSASQMVQLLGAEPNDNTKTSANVIICGIDCNGNWNETGVVGAGITAFRILNNRDAVNNEATFTFDRLTIFNCRGRNTYEETWYVGQSQDTPSGGLKYPYYTNALFFNLIGENSGNEVFQFGLCRNTNVFKCTFKNGGLRNQNLHEGLVQWSNGNRDCYFFMNYLEQGTHNLLQFFSGTTGGNNEFHSNVMYTLGKDADGGGNIWGRSDAHESLASIYYSFYQNTIVWTAGVSAFTLYENTTPWNKFYSADNIIVGATTTPDYEQGNVVNAANTLFNNYKVLTANIGTIGFVDAPNKDYHLSSLSSPAFGAKTTINRNSPFANYDYEGVEFVVSTPVRGAYSGYELMV